MRSNRIPGLTAAIALAFVAAPAFAQDAFSPTASGKRTTAVVGFAHLQPHGNPGDGLKLDGSPAPTLSVAWNINDNAALEFWYAADKFHNRVRSTSTGKIGTVHQLPVALSAQYHFGDADATFRPFVGLGYYQTRFSNESIDGLLDVDTRVKLEKERGGIGTIGVDMNFNETWFARVDARYMRSRPELRTAGHGTGEHLKLDPWTLGMGIGARF